MPETFDPVTMTNGAGIALDQDYFNRLEAGIESVDSRAVNLELGITPLATISYAATITPDAAASSTFRCTATGDLTLADPINGADGQTIRVEILASGATRTLSFAGGTATAVTIPSGTWWKGDLTYHANTTTWVLVD